LGSALHASARQWLHSVCLRNGKTVMQIKHKHIASSKSGASIRQAVVSCPPWQLPILTNFHHPHISCIFSSFIINALKRAVFRISPTCNMIIHACNTATQACGTTSQARSTITHARRATIHARSMIIHACSAIAQTCSTATQARSTSIQICGMTTQACKTIIRVCETILQVCYTSLQGIAILYPFSMALASISRPIQSYVLIIMYAMFLLIPYKYASYLTSFKLTKTRHLMNLVCLYTPRPT
jgi:hypothetical protein